MMEVHRYVQMWGIDDARKLLAKPHLFGLYPDRKYLRIKQKFVELEGGFTLEDLQSLVDSFELVNRGSGLQICRERLESVESPESEYGSRMGVEYRKSEGGPEALALMLCSDGSWVESRHFNQELDDMNKFLNLARLRQAVKDVELCQ